MLPYVAQGAANVIEDAGALAAALACSDNIEDALTVYEEVRKDRGEKIQISATTTRHNLHLPDGPDQRKLNKAIRNAGIGNGENPDWWADQRWQHFRRGVDVMKDTGKLGCTSGACTTQVHT
ncbi:hypothetical protein JX266_014084 [Neoarthrinium moseri]|nr:hypothetical protein JX266_014084 [Neoarthrinium moseri]